MEQSYHLVVVGFDEIVANKYLPSIQAAKNAGHIESYSVLDLEYERQAVDARLRELTFKPETVFYLPDPRQRTCWDDPGAFVPILEQLRSQKHQLRIYIATEVKAHEPYLRYCVENQVDSLVEKPVVAPMLDGRFDPNRIEPTMQRLVRAAAARPAQHSVMTLSRYHPIYNERVIDALRDRMLAQEAPLTSFHLRAAGGVWNLHREFEEREDHPYKYGYGMLMHGAYHYVDLAAQCLSLNATVFPSLELEASVSSFGAFPRDQCSRVPVKFAQAFDDDAPGWSSRGENESRFGETDIVSVFRVREVASGRTVTLGTLSFEQTTPSIRHWKDIPPNLYNKNGRTSFVDMEAQLSTLHTVNVQCFDVPRGAGVAVDRIDAFARVSTRTNAALLNDECFNTEETFEGLFHSDSNRRLMQRWLSRSEDRSRLADHLLPMRITQALAVSLRVPGQPVTFRLL
ncbi:hypothetical protein [Sorangium sp. So ce363]|uniref:hypothetical protein n=1 Tax=Sorangium sp. So ce363 TaxID=3133304 RepID=UPI003F5FE6FD